MFTEEGKNGPMRQMFNTSPQQRTQENKVSVVNVCVGGDSDDTTKGKASAARYEGSEGQQAGTVVITDTIEQLVLITAFCLCMHHSSQPTLS